MNPWRIARIITRLNLGGPARQILAMTPHLRERGFETHVLTGPSSAEEGDLREEIERAGAIVHPIDVLVRAVSPWRDLFAWRSIRSVLRQVQPHLVHTHMAKAGWHGRRAARSLRLPCVHTFHGHLLEGYFGGFAGRVYRWLERRACRGTQRIVCVSERTLDDLVRAGIVPPERTGIIRPGIDLDPFLALEPPRFASDGITLGFVGRLVPIKAPLVFLDVVERLRSSGYEVSGVILGDGPLASTVDAAIEERGLGGVVTRRPATKDMPSLHGSIDALVITSRQEGLPVAAIEASASARPVVSFAVGGIDELIVPERTGHLAPPGDTARLARWTEELLRDRVEAKAMGVRGRTRVRGTYTARRLADEHVELYRSLLEPASS